MGRFFYDYFLSLFVSAKGDKYIVFAIEPWQPWLLQNMYDFY